MRFLADEGVSISTVQCLRDLGHDAVHVRDVGLTQTRDSTILEFARQQGYTIVAFDLDFGDLMAAAGSALPSVILLRTRDQTPASVNSKLIQAVSARKDELVRGAIVIVEDSRHRVRPLPLDR